MDSSPLPSTPQTSSSNTNAAEQARLRKERREAKIRAGGSARLGKITSMGGRPPESATPPPQPSSSPPQGAKPHLSPSTSDPDPEEVDISRQSPEPPSYGPARPEQQQETRQQQAGMGISEEQIRQMMARLNPDLNASHGGNIMQSQEPRTTMEEDQTDPMARLLQQLLHSGGGGGGGTTEGGGGGGGGGLPPALAQMMGQAAAAAPQQQDTQPSGPLWWQMIHLLSSVTLGIYLILSTTFTGSQTQRIAQSPSQQTQYPYQPFYLFATLELLLQSTRFFIDKGGAQGSAGFLMGLVDILPPPWRARVLLALRYGGIVRTVVRDGLVVLFVLGVVGWVRGSGASS